ncbi:N-acetylmuramoyl-L-alanine amidase family protein [Geopsychrobacter electrodiphilus]|uniref:N-acetylmuramoyl-L-alanine amidase family protein n=1 Tax=Geopsychrobacter electrodiphilus TaxID=225196 RepID=UPI0003798277|nr:N-acetylmuramoyl-L-alanine amidase [Geopsychrobacter electrodiphilus]
MSKLLYLIFLLLLLTAPAYADIELAPKGKQPLLLTDVYLQNGLPYVALDDVLDAVSLRGDWDSVKHVYRINTPQGTAELSPGRQNLKLGDNFYPLKEKPRFIDGRLRVSENFILGQLPMLINRPIYYRNLNPVEDQSEVEDNSLDRLFSFLLRKKNAPIGNKLRGVAIDVGHGGLDTGVIAPDGYKEKEFTLALAERLSKTLKMNLGIPVYLSRDEDYELTPKQRLAPVTHEDADVWLLLHAQGGFSPQAAGAVLFIRGHKAKDGQAPRDESRDLAKYLSAALVQAGVPVAGIFSSPLIALGKGSLPTVQLELGYLTNPDDLARLRSSAGQQQLAQALYQGLQDFTLNRKIN